MKNTVYKYFFYEFLRYFTITIFALGIIVWTIQAVNFLDLVTEDGHAFSIYFLYSFLTLSKVLTKLIPFCFLLATTLVILKFEKDNELIILWTSGLNKIQIVNLIFRISLLIMLVQLFFTIFLNPVFLNKSRSLLKNSELQFIPSLLKERQFNDTVDGLTIFVEDKNEDNVYSNIFIRDEGRVLSQIGTSSYTIFAKSGYVNEKNKNLILFNGNIQKLEQDGNVNVVKFDKTSLNLGGLATKSISEPKMQETSTFKIFNCFFDSSNEGTHNCKNDKKTLADIKIEVNKRFGMPIYIPLISLICCFLLTSRKDKKIFTLNKYIYFFIGILILASAEILVRYSGMSWIHSVIYYLMPLTMMILSYFILIKTFKYENLT